MKPTTLVLVAVALCTSPTLARNETHRLGFEYSEPREIPGVLAEVQAVPVLAGHPCCDSVDSVDLSHQMPPIADQGNQLSCMAWSFGYYNWSHTQWVEDTTRDLTDPRFQCSPAFVYNQLNGGRHGALVFETLAPLLVEQGCASLAECPYNEGDFWTWPSETAYVSALSLRAAGAGYILLYDSARLDLIKQRLCNGYTTVLGIWVWTNFDSVHNFNNTYCVSERYGDNRGGHAVCVVGYDDSRTTNDGPGALKLANSWGTGWADSGYCWMSYAAVLDQATSSRVAYYLDDRIGYRPRFVGRVRLEHARRDRVGIRLGLGSPDAPRWYYDYRWWRTEFIPRPFPDHNLVFDMTEAESLFVPGQTDTLFVGCIDDISDSLTGWVRYFQADDMDTLLSVSTDPPVVIPDAGSYAHACAYLRDLDRDVSAFCILSPVGVVEPDSIYAPEVEVRNFGRAPATFPVRLTIGTGYADSVEVMNLPSHSVTRVQFRDWTAPASGAHPVRCSTALAGDEYPGNDACTTSVRSRWHDVAVVEILVPPDTVGIDTAVRPKVTVRNNGTQAETFIATFRIADEGYERSSRVTPLGPDSSADVSFASWTPQHLGHHLLSCTLALDGDQADTNNVITGGVYVTGIAEASARGTPGSGLSATVIRRVLSLQNPVAAPQSAIALFSISGRRVMDLEPGLNDIRHVSPGVYFVRRPMTEDGRPGAAVRKVVIQR